MLRGQCVPGGSSLRPISEALLGAWRSQPFPPEDALHVFRGPLSRLVPGWATDAVTTSSAEDPLVLAEGVLELLRNGVPAHGAGARGPALGRWRHPRPAGPSHSRDSGCYPRDGDRHQPHRRAGVGRAAPAPRPPPGRPPAPGPAARAARRATWSADGPAPRSPPDAVELVVEASAGLPLLAEELFAGLVEGRSLVAGADGWERTALLVTPIPPSLVGLVASRLARLAPEDIAVVAAAAVSGDPGDWRLLVEATGQEEDHVLAALRAAVTAHLLTADGPRLAWRHALTREAVLASLPGPDLDISREHVAGALAARSDDDASTARAAELWAAQVTTGLRSRCGGRWRVVTSWPAGSRRPSAS